MKMTKKESKALDKRISEAYSKVGNGVQVSILDIPHIYAAGRAAVTAGTDLEQAMKDAITKYRKN